MENIVRECPNYKKDIEILYHLEIAQESQFNKTDISEETNM